MTAPPLVPPGLLGAALLLWGYSNGQLWAGVLAAVVMEGLRILRSRAPIEPSAMLLRRVVRLCMLAAIALLVYGLLAQGVPQALYTWLRWLPLVLLPVVALGLLSPTLRLSQWARAMRPELPFDAPDRLLEPSHGFAAVTLAAAAMGTAAEAWLYPALAGVIAWALVGRIERVARRSALLMFLLAAVLGHGLHQGIAHLQGRVEDWTTEWLMTLMAPPADAMRERTRIGDLGRVKLSDRVLLRVEAPGPLLLRETAFERYVAGEWRSTRPTPQAAPGRDGRWQLGEGDASAGANIVVRRSFPAPEALLPLPLGSQAIEGLSADAVDVYPAGAVRARGLPRRAAMTVHYDEAQEVQAPQPADLQVPDGLRPLLDDFAAREGLDGLTAAAAVARLQDLFAQQFRYSLDLGPAEGAGRTLADFLLRDRRGHCEYFATATVLLLRQAGVPARYVGGYSVQEFSALEQAYVVRARHAHAWAVAHVDGRWVHVDTTPARWAEAEGAAVRSAWSPLLDHAAWLLERGWRAWERHPIDGPTRHAGAILLGGGLLVAMLWLGWLGWRRRRPARAGRAPPHAVGLAWEEVEARLAALGHPRDPQETVADWARRLREQAPGEAWRQELAALAEAYHAARFDPSTEPSVQTRFIATAKAWRPTNS